MGQPPAARRKITDMSFVVRAANHGPLTLAGTNSYLLGTPMRSLVVVDPGPDEAKHIAALTTWGQVELILLTHRHDDHVAAAGRVAALTGAPIRAADPALCAGGPVLRDGEMIAAAGVDIGVLATPGHTADSVCLHLATERAMLTGDTILGRGSAMIDATDGSLADYFASLDRLAEFGKLLVLPGHGPIRDDLAGLCAEYLAHRHQRLGQVRQAMAELGCDDVAAVTSRVYPGVEPGLRVAAESSVQVQLAYLAQEGR